MSSPVKEEGGFSRARKKRHSEILFPRPRGTMRRRWREREREVEEGGERGEFQFPHKPSPAAQFPVLSLSLFLFLSSIHPEVRLFVPHVEERERERRREKCAEEEATSINSPKPMRN